METGNQTGNTTPTYKVTRFYGIIPQKEMTSLVSCDPGRMCNKVATTDRPCRRSNTLRLSITTWWLLGNKLSPILTCSSIVARKFLVENELKYEIYNHTHTVESYFTITLVVMCNIPKKTRNLLQFTLMDLSKVFKSMTIMYHTF